MEAAGDHTYFSAYTRMPSLNAANNPVYAAITEAKKCYDTAEKARLLGLFSGERV